MKEIITNSGFDELRVGDIISPERIKKVQGLCQMGTSKRSFFHLKDKQIYVEEQPDGAYKVTSIGRSQSNFLRPYSPEIGK